MQKTNKWQTLTSTYVLENPWYKVRKDIVIRPDGKEGTFNVVECGESVFIIPLTQENKILLVKLYRYPTQHEGWEIPAGGVEHGEQPLVAAKRELQEETGMISKTWRKLGSFDSMNGMTDSVAHVFEVKNLTQTNRDEQVEEGITDLRAFTIQEIVAMIQDGSIVDGVSIAALMQFFIAHNMITTTPK